MDLPAELLYGILFVAMLLVQYLMKRFGLLPTPDEAPQQAPPAQEPAEHDELFAESPFDSSTEPVRASWADKPVSTVAISTALPAPTKFLGSRRDLQRAVYSMAVLGPCRALEPPDDR